RREAADDEIVLARFLNAVRRGHARVALGAVPIHEANSVFADGFQMRPASYDRHVLTSGRQLHCQVAADRSRTHHADSHANPPTVRTGFARTLRLSRERRFLRSIQAPQKTLGTMARAADAPSEGGAFRAKQPE